MKLTLATIAAVLICLLSLAARSTAMKATALAAPQAAELTPREKVAVARIDGHLRTKLRKFAKR